jgi:hypothetical protein
MRDHAIALSQKTIWVSFFSHPSFDGCEINSHPRSRNKLKSAQQRPSIIASCWKQATLW